MPSDQTKKVPSIDRQRITRIAVLLIIFAIAILCWLWWSKVYESPSNVFWGMIDNNLSTSDFTKLASEAASSESLQQLIQVNLRGADTAHSFSTLQQAGTVIKTEEINTQHSDYVRYVSIKTNQLSAAGKPINFKSIIGIWGSGNASKTQTISQLLNQSLLEVIPIGNISDSQRHDLVALIKNKNVYSINYAKAKRQTVGDRLEYVYQVSVSPEGYIELLQAFAKDIGVSSLNTLQPQSYASDPAVTFMITIDASSRDLVRVVYPGNSQQENYAGYGLVQPALSLPTKTISQNSLQAKLQALK